MGAPASNIVVGNWMTPPTDTCNTPTPAGPVPFPYPNETMTNMANPATMAENVMVGGGNAVIENFETMLSNLDQAGTLGGVVSGMFMGTCQLKGGSPTVEMCGRGAGYLGSLTAHNGSNANMPAGAQITPGVPNVLIGL